MACEGCEHGVYPGCSVYCDNCQEYKDYQEKEMTRYYEYTAKNYWSALYELSQHHRNKHRRDEPIIGRDEYMIREDGPMYVVIKEVRKDKYGWSIKCSNGHWYKWSESFMYK